MIISIIAAMDQNRLIGSENDLPWHLPVDMKYFKETTLGHYVLTGRKNYESIPEKFRPLKGRTNLVVSNSKIQFPGAIMISNIEEGIEIASRAGEKELFIIGGGQVFKQSMYLANKLYITLIHHQFNGDVFFPEINWKQWNIISRKDVVPDENNKYACSFIVAERISVQ
ncbi:MAG TPA: dihydrofolate reductase [Bacteroidia bacterium]|jgi:dihydrofolate reductase|nr:dihydrofolate reductase [Bacteroidia bacterium]HMX97786.1 dihydrofolate reductase [Bacteroidia bacterium]HMY64824.1 dihydrofolate reductase [Bacteroidia bacterium]HNB33163.1 dihydrofolate reductase [Bacteroidia bacterium]HNC33242.1 dihydrofolate reductase [Bacteroidia bacterium]